MQTEGARKLQVEAREFMAGSDDDLEDRDEEENLYPAPQIPGTETADRFVG